MVDSVAARARATAVALTVALGLLGCGGSSSSEPAGHDSARQHLPAPLGAGRGQLDAGTHVLDLVARDARGTGPAHLPKIEITVPRGWFNLDGWALVKGIRRLRVAVAFWHVAQVYATPCRWAGEPLVDPGEDVDSLASTLASQPLRNATAPIDVALGGFRGKYLELSVPADVEFADCDEGSFESWTADGWASDRYQQAPGQVDRIWVLDLRGDRLVVDATYLPRASRRDRADLDGVVRSIRFLG